MFNGIAESLTNARHILHVLRVVGKAWNEHKSHPDLLARRGEPLPPADHQYTWLTVVLLSEKAPGADVIEAVKKARFTRFYRFYLRGYSEGRVLLVDLENRRLYTNRAGRGLKKLYQLAFDNIAKAEKKRAEQQAKA